MLNMKIATDAALEVRKAVSQLQEQKAGLFREMTELNDQREAHYRQPVPAEDIKQFIFDAIDNSAGSYMSAANWAGLVKRIAYPKRNPHRQVALDIKSDQLTLMDIEAGLLEGGGINSQIFGRDRLGFFEAGILASGADPGVCFFFGDIIKSKIEEHFNELLPSETFRRPAGLPVKERYAEIARLDGELERLKAEIKDVETQLQQLGVTI